MYNIADGRLLASVNISSYLSSSLADDDLISTSASFSSSFCLLQVSADLSTAVAVTQCHTAIAANLDHYFRYSMSLFLPSIQKFMSALVQGTGETNRYFCLPGHIQTTYCVLMPPFAPVSGPNTPKTRTACPVPTATSSP